MLGAILAGGAASRMGGGKAARMLVGRPLISYSLEALAAACERVAVVCKPDGELPEIGTAELWDDEPAEPLHPAAGIAHALDRAGAHVLVCAADMPFVTADDCKRLIASAAAHPGVLAVIASAEDDSQPTLGVYAPAAAEALRAAAIRGDPLRRVGEELGAVYVDLPPGRLRSVNTEADLAAAEAELLSRGPG